MPDLREILLKEKKMRNDNRSGAVDEIVLMSNGRRDRNYLTCFYKSYYLSRANKLCALVLDSSSPDGLNRSFISIHTGLMASNYFKRSFCAPSTFSHNYI